MGHSIYPGYRFKTCSLEPGNINIPVNAGSHNKKYVMINTIIKRSLVPANDFIFGFADLRGLINKKFNGFHFGIAIGKRLDDKIIDKLIDGPTIEYFNYYKQINTELLELARKIQTDLMMAGIVSMIIEPTISLSAKDNEKYLKTLTCDFSHKMAATRAGLGWIGKTDLFISKAFGPRLRLVSILIRQNPGIDTIPIEESKCGKCALCVEKCPANAANGILWNINIHRDEFFDAQKCRDKCWELARQRLNVDERICGICVFICPVGKMKKK
jgi:epoxyqueuosine reductase